MGFAAPCGDCADTITCAVVYKSGVLEVARWVGLLAKDPQPDRTQNLAWDARGRLFKVSERDAQTNGFEWTTVFDPFGRRLRTVELVVTNGGTNTTQPLVISQFYDPEVEFLEVAVAVNVQTTWKLHGPDLNGAYGGLNGLGGFDAIVPGPHLFCPVLSDARGNVLAVYDQDHGKLMWNAARPTGYGAVPGYRPPALGHGANLVQASAWRGRWMDVIGSYQIGLRPYSPEAGHWDAPDSLGHDADPALFTFVGGDPINGWDPDGRFMVGMARLDASLSQLSQLLGQANAQSHFAALDSMGGNSSFAPNQDALWQGSVNDGYDQLWSSKLKAARYEAAVDSTRAWYEKTAVDWGMETEARHRQQLSTLLDWTPGVNAIKATFQTTLGFDLVTGGDVSRGWNAAMVGLSFAPGLGLTRPLSGGYANFLERSALSEIGLAGRTGKNEVTALAKFYPENAGFARATERTFLMPGQTIDRYGGSGISRFFSPQGTPDWARSLPPGTTGQPLRTFEVVKPFEVESGAVAPWFNQPGGGLQYRTSVKLEILLKRGIIKEITRK